MSTWVHETLNGKLTGNAVGGFTDTAAREWIDSRRHARDTDPAWSAYRDGYDWHVVEFTEDGSGVHSFTY